MFRGWIQTQAGKQYGPWIGLLLGAILFGLRHLPADLFYAQVWQATPQMWVSRQVQLYLVALGLGLARHYGKSTYASAIMHALVFIMALFGLG
jgi:membrane protease YdiL (CAAX protease family)